MKIHALSTGTVRLKRSFLHPKPGWRRQLGLFTPGEWDPRAFPIHCWAIEHDGRLIVVDSGETADVHDVPFARFEVGAGDELPAVLSAAGFAIEDVDTLVLTHMHGDHMDGAIHHRGPVLVHAAELAATRTAGARFFQRVLRQPIPALEFHEFTLDGGPFGAFPASHPITDDGRIVAVDTAGHTPGHVSVLCIDDDGRHVLLAGDATDTLTQLREQRVDAVAPKPAVHLATMRTILAHAERHPTVYLPSHDPDSAARLRDGTTVSAPTSTAAP